uniref:Serpin domain-containing protein n=1 Tax=Crocodylus porosus TaxID=8502 RepID=A0A7M4FKH7_CROPO
MGSLSKSVAEFCLDLFHEVNKPDPKKNIFFSPMSISVALATVYLGTKGNTAAQMEKVSSSMAEVGKIWSMGQIQPTRQFHLAHRHPPINCTLPNPYTSLPPS